MLDDSNLRAAIAAAPLCRGLQEKEIEALVAICEARTWTPGNVIFREGDESDALYVVAGGEVAITKRGRDGQDRTVAMLPPATVFGEVGLLTGSVRSATATASGKVVLVAIPAARFKALLENEQLGAFKVVSNLAISVSLKLADLNEHLLRLYERTEPEPLPRQEDLADFRRKLMVDWGF